MLADLTRMESMVSRILDSVRLERGRVDLKSEPVELAAAVGRVVAQFEERARQEHIALSVAEVPRGLAVLADPLAVDVVVRNLLENALAAVGAVSGGSVALHGARSRTARWSCRCATAELDFAKPTPCSSSRNSRACIRAAAAAITARGLGSSSCGV